MQEAASTSTAGEPEDEEGGRQTGMLSVSAEACQGQILPLSHHGACPRQSHWFNGGFTQG